MIKAIADWRNVHSKLFYLDQNLRNFCLPYYSNDPDESIQRLFRSYVAELASG